jgi:hypothetical protein
VIGRDCRGYGDCRPLDPTSPYLLGLEGLSANRSEAGADNEVIVLADLQITIIRRMSIAFGDPAWLALAVIVAGVATGVLAGVFGVGGGAIAVPVLYELFRLLGVPDAVRMQLCIGTSLAIILPTAWCSYRARKARGAVLHRQLERPGAAIVVSKRRAA